MLDSNSEGSNCLLRNRVGTLEPGHQDYCIFTYPSSEDKGLKVARLHYLHNPVPETFQVKGYIAQLN